MKLKSWRLTNKFNTSTNDKERITSHVRVFSLNKTGKIFFLVTTATTTTESFAATKVDPVVSTEWSQNLDA